MGTLNKVRYSHRDFDSIKKDLINAIPSLTQEWTSREESDPGIVLIKLMSMLGDNLSYNIDKIALELYIQTVTQRKNCSKILGLLGYKMHWYRSGTIGMQVRLREEYDSQGNPNHVVLYPFRTTFKSSSGEIVYTLVSNGPGSGEIDILSSEYSTMINLVEGRVVKVNFTKNSLVNNRYYFSENNVDEAHIWLTFGNSRTFNLVDNLYLVTDNASGSFEFNVDEFDRPYIELVSFWEDIVGNAATTAEFTLYYFLSNGEKGNVSKNQLVRVQEVGGQYSESASQSLVMSHPGNNQSLEDDSDSNIYTSQGHDPQTVNEAKKDAYNYIFTHDTLVTASDYEKAARRVPGITASKIIDNEIIELENGRDPEKVNEVFKEISTRCYDEFGTVTDEDGNTSLLPYQAILYVIYQNAASSTDEPNGTYNSSNEYTSREGKYKFSSYNIFNVDPPGEDSPFYGLGYFPYKPMSFITTQVSDLLSESQTLNVKVGFGTTKIFPFTVNGMVYLNEPISPQDTLLVVNNIDSALSNFYYPGNNVGYGDLPRFIDIVETIQSSDINIKYFDAGDNSLISWSKVCIRENGMLKGFDSTSFAKYNGLNQNFSIAPQFLKFRIKNTSTSTIVLKNLTGLRQSTDPESPEVKVIGKSYSVIQVNSLEELKVFCNDLQLNPSLSYAG